MSNQRKESFRVTEEVGGERIDKYLTLVLKSLSRSYIQKLIKEEKVFVNHKIVKANYRVEEEDFVEIEFPEPVELNVEAEDIPLDILYEDQDILIINKPKGMVVHPSAGHYTGTLVNALLFHCQNSLSGINGILRPGIVHRIDMDTTGLLVVCKNDEAHRNLAEQLKVHSITRKYHAIVYGTIKEEEGTVEGPIGRHPTDRKKMAINARNGKPATTHYRVLERFQGYTYIECCLETGRTHQIRVHMASIHHPLLGDNIYCSLKPKFALPVQGQILHAKVLGFLHPKTGQYMEFHSELPDYFVQILKKLRNLS